LLARWDTTGAGVKALQEPGQLGIIREGDDDRLVGAVEDPKAGLPELISVDPGSKFDDQDQPGVDPENLGASQMPESELVDLSADGSAVFGQVRMATWAPETSLRSTFARRQRVA
jgi:hypothetical protein